MPPNYHVGQRVSFKSALGTIRYVGFVEGTEKEWLGLEWDNPTRGKHDGTHKGKKYFSCKSRSSTAASFIPTNTKSDPTQSFVEAIYQKYATLGIPGTTPIPIDKQIEISGKIVEEVGFDKIRQQQAQLDRLKIAIVDGFRITVAETTEKRIREVCPKVVELDLSRNLFEDCREIVRICAELDNLRSLRLNGNRLEIREDGLGHAEAAFKGIKELEMNDMQMSWQEVCELASRFQDLEQLKASSNGLKDLSSRRNFSMPHVASLTLNSNDFIRLADLEPICQWEKLENLYLKGNHISQILGSDQRKPVFGSKLHYVDLSSNEVTSWAFVDELSVVFPGLTALRFSDNPIYDGPSKEGTPSAVADEAYMFTIARIGGLKTLNFSNITAKDRENAEMFYLSRIGKELAEVSETEEHTVLKQHKRFEELCNIHGAPVIVRKDKNAADPNFVEGRLIKFKLYLTLDARQPHQRSGEKVLEIPKSFDIYRVKGFVGRLFAISPMKIRLIWETGEWDPVAGYEEELDSSDDDEDGDADEPTVNVIDPEKEALREKGKWMRREVEIEDGLRQIGHWVDGTEACVRVELI